MVCPRRSAPRAGNRSTPSSAPCGMVGRETASSLVFGPLGAVERNQISQNAVPFPATTLEPSFCSVAAMEGARSAGGAPAGCALYCEKAAPAAIIRSKSDLSISTYYYRCAGQGFGYTPAD